MSIRKDLLQNRYRLRTVLGTGGFSTIYLAIDETTGIGDAAHLNDQSKMINETFDLQGRKLEQPVRGISIRKAADGTAQKVLMK